MNKLAYRCKFCGREGVASYDPECPPLRLEIWSKLLACDRCADYHEARRDVSRGIIAAALAARAIRINSKPSEAVNKRMESIRVGLVALTKRFAKVVCDYYRRPPSWEPEFVELIMEKPEESGRALAFYIRTMRLAVEQSGPPSTP